MLRKILAFVMCVVMLCGTGLVANAEAAENQVQPRYNYTNIITATLANSDGKALCAGSVTGYNGTTTKIAMTITLQKKTLLWWSDVQVWSRTTYTYYNDASYTKSVESGTHRVKVVATVYSGSNSETVDCISKTYDF
ncbi:MAG: hypothetical protein IJZ75_00430 [Clostridia bacterium]|nr:hypothetical protein [Clostridia bacterium]